MIAWVIRSCPNIVGLLRLEFEFLPIFVIVISTRISDFEMAKDNISRVKLTDKLVLEMMRNLVFSW